MADTPPAPDPGDFPLKRHLGMSIDSGDSESGHGTAHLQPDERHHNPNGVVHGAVLFAMIDTAMGKATMDCLPEGLICASIEVHLRFLRPASAGTLIAEATVTKQGRRIVFLDGEIHDGDGRLIATASGTFAVIEP